MDDMEMEMSLRDACFVLIAYIVLAVAVVFTSNSKESERWESFQTNIIKGQNVILYEEDESKLNEFISKFYDRGYCLKKNATGIESELIASNTFIFYKCR